MQTTISQLITLRLAITVYAVYYLGSCTYDNQLPSLLHSEFAFKPKIGRLSEIWRKQKPPCRNHRRKDRAPGQMNSVSFQPKIRVTLIGSECRPLGLLTFSSTNQSMHKRNYFLMNKSIRCQGRVRERYRPRLAFLFSKAPFIAP